jgi:thiol-disulfide isomerase/thioredoxin
MGVALKGIVGLGFLLVSLVAVANAPSLVLRDGTDVVLSAQAAEGDVLFIWLPSEAGPQESEPHIARQLARLGVTVWRVDLLESRFLPVASSSVDMLPATDVADLIAQALRQTDKQVYVVATGRSAIPVLRGVAEWQRSQKQVERFKGAILVSPKFFVETPEPGVAAELMPIVSASNLPIAILQPEQSPWYWKLPLTVPALEQGGSEVTVRLLRGVRDRYYFRPDAVAAERLEARRLPAVLLNSARLLATIPAKVRETVALTTSSPRPRTSKKARVLKPYRGDPVPPPLALQDMNGQAVALQQLRGKVVLINFWASWCPPCVHEMPSMQRLADGLAAQPFVILGVNMAEDKAVVADFLANRIAVRFPILLDSDGTALKRWQVFAFPTSFVLDKQGRIRYALFGATQWDDAAVLAILHDLLKEPG